MYSELGAARASWFHGSHALVDFEAVCVPFTVTPFKDLEAFPGRFVSHRLRYRNRFRLPYRTVALEPDHSLVDALFSGCLFTIFKTKIEVGEKTSDTTERIRLSPLLIRNALFFR